MPQLDVYYQPLSQHVSGIIMPIFTRTRPCVTARGVLRWFCWMWLVAVVECCVVRCVHCEGYCSNSNLHSEHCVTFTVLAPYNAAPHNRYQPHPTEPAQHTKCSLDLLKMGIMMPETYWESIDNKHLIVASCWFSISLHNLLTMHGYRNLKSFTYFFLSLLTLYYTSNNSVRLLKQCCVQFFDNSAKHSNPIGNNMSHIL